MLLFSKLKWSHWTHNTNFFHHAQLLSQMENHDFMCGLWVQARDLLSINPVSLTSSSRKPGKTFIQQRSFCQLLSGEVKQIRWHYLLISCFKGQTVAHGPNPRCHLFLWKQQNWVWEILYASQSLKCLLSGPSLKSLLIPALKWNN